MGIWASAMMMTMMMMKARMKIPQLPGTQFVHARVSYFHDDCRQLVLINLSFVNIWNWEHDSISDINNFQFFPCVFNHSIRLSHLPFLGSFSLGSDIISSLAQFAFHTVLCALVTFVVFNTHVLRQSIDFRVHQTTGQANFHSMSQSCVLLKISSFNKMCSTITTAESELQRLLKVEILVRFVHQVSFTFLFFTNSLLSSNLLNSLLSSRLVSCSVLFCNSLLCSLLLPCLLHTIELVKLFLILDVPLELTKVQALEATTWRATIECFVGCPVYSTMIPVN